MMAKFTKNQSLKDFQKLIENLYSLPDDRLYSIWDILTQQQRFAMRALKGIRKGDVDKLKLNLLISLSWIMAVGNRLHIEVEEELWKRFPNLCSYCGKKPCECKKTKPNKRKKAHVVKVQKPRYLSGFQKMFQEIYPSGRRTLADAGVHFAEETGEVHESVHNYLGQHKIKQFNKIKLELADLVSCIFGIANSSNIDVAHELAKMFSSGCHVCHQTPCVCGFTKVANIKT